MQDYNYWMHGCYELTIEVSCCKYPNPDKLPILWSDNKNSLISYLKLANTGIRGIITFFNNQPAANLSIQINSIEPIFKTSSTGEYYRILLPGNYKLKVLANCNVPIYTASFSVGQDNLLTVLNVTLSQEHYNNYMQQVNGSNNNALFCTKSRQPAKCGFDCLKASIQLIIAILILISI